MVISINTNKSALSAIGVLRSNDRQASVITERIITGKRVNSAKDNASSFSMAKTMRADIATMNSVNSSINRGISVVDIAISSAQTVSDLLIGLREKAVLFADASDDETKNSIIEDYNNTIKQINNVVDNAKFNDTNLLKAQAIETSSIIKSNLTHSDGKMELGDFNLDGNTDIYVNGLGGTTRALGDGKGKFTDLINSVSTTLVGDSGDIDNDGDVELLAVLADRVYIVKNDGQGQTDGVVQVGFNANGQTEGLIQLGDFNNDGNKEFVRRNSANSIETFSNDGAFAFTSNGIINMANITDILDIKTSDLDNNGKDDIVVSGTGGGHGYIETYTSNGNGTFNFSSSQQFNSATDVSNIELEDFNNDGNTDIASLSTASGSTNVNLMTGNADGTFIVPPTILASYTAAPIMESGDVNNDGYKDLVILDGNNVGSTTDDSLSILQGRGDGTFITGTALTDTTITQNMKDMEIADVTGDNINDIIWSDANTPDSANNTFVMERKAGNFSVQLTSTGSNLDVAYEAMDTSSLGLFKLALNSSSKGINRAINFALDKVNLQLSRLGSASKRLEGALRMNILVQDKLEEGVGKLVDADLPKEAAQQQALAVKLQLGMQTLGVATQSPFQILTLFGIGR